MPIKEVNKVCFAGAGTMGCYNSLIAALSGYGVTLYDISEEALEQVPERQLNWSETLVGQGIADYEAIQAAAAAIIRTTDPSEAALNADFFSESVFERLDLKREIHSLFDGLLPDHAIMTTNTSTLLPSKIEKAVKRGEKFAAMHFHQSTPLVDIVPGPRTSPETLDTVQRFVKSRGRCMSCSKKSVRGICITPCSSPSSGLPIRWLYLPEPISRKSTGPGCLTRMTPSALLACWMVLG